MGTFQLPSFRYAVQTPQGLVWHETTDVIGRAETKTEDLSTTRAAANDSGQRRAPERTGETGGPGFGGAGGDGAEPASSQVTVTTYATTAGEGDRVELRVSRPAPGTIRMHWKVVSGQTPEWTACSFPVGEDEHFYGFGETYGELNQRGVERHLWVENGWVRDLSYKPVPFCLSSAGYGVYADHSERMYVRVATPDIGNRIDWKVNSAELVLYGFEAEDAAGVIERYTALVGRPTLPPPWFFGAWKSRDWRTETQETVMLDLRKQRELGIPCSVKLIDAAWEQELNDFRFHREKFPDFTEVMKEAKRLDYQVVIWISPWVAEWTDIYKELDATGYFLKRPDGRTYVHRLGNSPSLRGSMIDFTNPEAKRWWQEQIESLMKLGVRGIKTDFGEQVPEDAVFHDGRTGKTMHNLYPVLYNRATHEVVAKYRGVLLGRSAWSGSQAFTGIWAGDQTADFAPRSGMLATIYAGQNVGLSGFPYWGSDIGGYFGTPDRECFIRWTQYAAFTPCMELHGLGERDPWDMDEESLENYKFYTGLHTRLFPYVYPLAIEASRRGTPIMRAMMLHYGGDRLVHELECAATQYMFGEDILVAPIFFEGRRREVYLPAGDWVDWWSGERVSGPWRGQAEAALTNIPLWLRAGAVVPMLPAGTETIGAFDDPDRWLDALGGERWEFVLAPGSGHRRQGGVDIEQRMNADGTLTVNIRCDRERGPVPQTLALTFRFPVSWHDRYEIRRAGQDGTEAAGASNVSGRADGQDRSGEAAPLVRSWTDRRGESGLRVEIEGCAGTTALEIYPI